VAILIDAPRWPRAGDGVRFAHLASDGSHAELHAFVEELRLPRALRFHRDHYDVPEQWWDDVVARGAIPVTSRELVRRLRSAGLRRSR
jgi:hypothetical protein